MKIFDISWPITPLMTEYKDRKTVHVEAYKEFDRDGMRETMLTLHNHTGTHIDAPAHFLRDGKTSETISLEALNGPCRVLDLTHVSERITYQDLARFDIKTYERILLKTKNSALSDEEPFNPQFIYLGNEAALYLSEIEVACVGIDYLGIERNQPGRETHKYLLEANVIVVEGLRLGHVEPGEYQLCCLPLNIPGIDGVPARAILLSP